jgi:hypothetical protein
MIDRSHKNRSLAKSSPNFGLKLVFSYRDLEGDSKRRNRVLVVSVGGGDRTPTQTLSLSIFVGYLLSCRVPTMREGMVA